MLAGKQLKKYSAIELLPKTALVLHCERELFVAFLFLLSHELLALVPRALQYIPKPSVYWFAGKRVGG